MPHSCRLPPAPIQDHATAPDLLPCAVPYRKDDPTNRHPQDVVRVALTKEDEQGRSYEPNKVCSKASQSQGSKQVIHCTGFGCGSLKPRPPRERNQNQI